VPRLTPVPCKVGTQPWLVYRDRRQPLVVGRQVRIREASHGSKWFRVIVDHVDPFRVSMI